MSSVTWRCNNMLRSRMSESMFPSMFHIPMICDRKDIKIFNYTTMPSSNVSKRTQTCIINKENRKTWERNYTVLKQSIHHIPKEISPIAKKMQQWRLLRHDKMFHTEMEFHDIADETLECIQDCIEEQFEDDKDENKNTPEVNVSSGVLTLTLGSHGTWVINKQTPNRQIWWSSPISGPRRYEYDSVNEVWVYTRRLENEESGIESSTLGGIITKEIKELYDVDLDLNV